MELPLVKCYRYLLSGSNVISLSLSTELFLVDPSTDSLVSSLQTHFSIYDVLRIAPVVSSLEVRTRFRFV